MIYKNYILSKKLGGLDIYISIFFVCFYYHCWTFFFLLISLLVYFFVNHGDLLMQIVIFVFSFFCIIFTLIWLVLIRNICHLHLLTYLLKNKKLFHLIAHTTVQ